MMKKDASVLHDDNYIGPNLLSRLLMELRGNGRLEYALPTRCHEVFGIPKIENANHLNFRKGSHSHNPS